MLPKRDFDLPFHNNPLMDLQRAQENENVVEPSEIPGYDIVNGQLVPNADTLRKRRAARWVDGGPD